MHDCHSLFTARAENENSDSEDEEDDDDADYDNEALASDEDEIDEEGQQYIEKLEKSVSLCQNWILTALS